MTAHSLARLELAVERTLKELALVRVSGSVAEVASSHARVTGLSRFLQLLDCVAFDADDQRQFAEVVRIDGQGATVKTFDTNIPMRLGGRVYRIGHCVSRRIGAGRTRAERARRPIDAAGRCGRAMKSVQSTPHRRPQCSEAALQSP